MNLNPLDNLPSLSKEDCLKILNTPISELRIVSDYYKAVYHLLNYPCLEVEDALLNLLDSNSNELSILIAKRKAIEVLGRMNCIRAIDQISNCLYSSDPYTVENAAWSLKTLNCRDTKIHNVIASLLDDSRQNRRVLIQTLSKLQAFNHLKKIERFVFDENISPEVRGASIAALANLSGEKKNFSLLLSYLRLPHQNHRQCAVQDIIDAKAKEFLPNIIETPVAPFFRIRAIEELWSKELHKVNLYNTIDLVINDDPLNIRLLHSYDQTPNIEILIKQLFGTDFSRCYLALSILVSIGQKDITSELLVNLEKARKDYGAIYFFSILFRSIKGWEVNTLNEISEFLIGALNSGWPQFMKFRPSAILSLAYINPSLFAENLANWLNEEKTPYWACRYSAIMGLDNLIESNNDNGFEKHFFMATQDENNFVRGRAKFAQLHYIKRYKKN